MTEQHWYSYSVTDVGRKRKVNQDAIYANDQTGIWLVADGMGGHRDGDKASQAIVAAIKSRQFSNTLAQRIIEIEQLIRQLNDELQLYSKNNLNGQNTGSTIVLMTICEGICALIWAGDSRCYKVEQNNMTQLSWDHSYIDELLRAGQIAEEEAAISKMSNVITRAVGAHEELFFDHVLFPHSDQEVYLLCSDGLTNEMSDKEISDVIFTNGCSQASVDSLLAKTLASGAKDNVSIMLVACRQRRPININEKRLLENHTQAIRTASQAAYNNEIPLAEYYVQLKRQVELAIKEHQQFKGQGTKETAALSDIGTSPKLPITDNVRTQPNVSTPKSTVDLQYILLIFAMIILSGLLFFLLLQ
ncbi:PP2C family protein-serine/threonine phosphatase [Colwellia sp. MEBiC06753]